mmetsp:Transcript_70132/g.205155  ORF Transcript_70132/g.205155 Transcript_70132/m.205155 type:complete len:210 (-) Transcript_70132:452-1081(-)
MLLEVPRLVEDGAVQVPQRRRQRDGVALVPVVAVLVVHRLLLREGPVPPRAAGRRPGLPPLEDRPWALRHVEVPRLPGLGAGGLDEEVLPPEEEVVQLVLGHAGVVEDRLINPEAALHLDQGWDAHGDPGRQSLDVVAVQLSESQDLHGDVELVCIVRRLVHDLRLVQRHRDRTVQNELDVEKFGPFDRDLSHDVELKPYSTASIDRHE